MSEEPEVAGLLLNSIVDLTTDTWAEMVLEHQRFAIWFDAESDQTILAELAASCPEVVWFATQNRGESRSVIIKKPDADEPSRSNWPVWVRRC